jgi:protein-S-isoprenylcysteine O-methyltransferase Ste14
MKSTGENSERKNRASLHATLRGVVALYLLYLGWSVARGAGGADTTMPLWAGRLFGAVFAAAAAALGIYAWRRYRRDLRDTEEHGCDGSPDGNQE